MIRFGAYLLSFFLAWAGFTCYLPGQCLQQGMQFAQTAEEAFIQHPDVRSLTLRPEGKVSWESLLKLECLESLTLAGNAVTALPDELTRLPRLKSLALHGTTQLNPIQALRILCQLPNLEELTLLITPVPMFRDLPAAFPKLKKLNIHYNPFTEIPGAILTLTSLEELDLSFNQLRSIPPTISQLSHLRELKLRHNQIQSLPENLGEIPTLYEINLRENRLTALPVSFASMLNLKWLDISQNQFTHCPEPLIQLHTTLKAAIPAPEPGSLQAPNTLPVIFSDINGCPE